MKGERNSTMADKFLAKTTPEEIDQRNARAKADRERLRQEMKAKHAQRS